MSGDLSDMPLLWLRVDKALEQKLFGGGLRKDWGLGLKHYLVKGWGMIMVTVKKRTTWLRLRNQH